MKITERAIKFFRKVFILLSTGISLLAAQEERIIVEIGQEKITLEQLEKEMSRYRKSQNLKDRMEMLTEEGKKRILEQLIRERLFYLAAQEEGIKLSAEEEEQIAGLKKYLLSRKYISQKSKENSISEEEMKNYYEKNKDKFVIPERRKVSHIIVREKEKADHLLKRLKEGATFAEIAKENNIDGSKKTGGDLGWISKGHMVKEFEDVAFNLKKNEMSEVVSTKFGFHIIKVEDIKPEEQKNFQDVKEEIRKKIEEESIKQLEKDLRKKYNVRVNYEGIRKSGATEEK